MSHRRRFLNVVTRNWVTSVYSLHRIDLHSSDNNLFYPTAAAAEEAAAAAQDPSALFGGGTRRHVALNEVPQLRVPAAATQRFLHRQVPSSRYDPGPVCCVAVSESETVFLDCNSRGAFLYDADERCVVTLPDLHESKRFPVCLSVTSAGNDYRDDTIYVMDRSRMPPPPTGDTIQLQALVHRKVHDRLFYRDDWRCDELPPPPYIGKGDHDWRTTICSHALVRSASDVICVSTSGAGTYCFDTASRTWSKAGDWALSFAGKIEHDVDLGIWVGFLHYRRKDEVQRLCVTADLFSATDRRRVTLCRDAARLCGDDGKDLEPPYGWYQDHPHPLPKLVSLGSGKFCIVQFFETREEACSDYGQHCEDVVDKFAVFTGVEVMRCGGGGKDGDEQVGNGSADGDGAGDLRMIVHKTKRYMLPKDNEVTIEFVL